MRKLEKIFGKVRVLHLFIIFVSILASQLVFSAEKKVKEKNWWDEIISDVNFLKEYDWKGSLGGIVLRMGKKDYKVESCTQFLQSPKEYLNLNAIYPEIVGMAGEFNLKKALGDFWFKVCVKIDEEARKKLEEKFKFFKFIRIDVGGYFGWDTSDSGDFKGGMAFKVVEWKF